MGKIAIFIFGGLTLLLIITHLERVDYFLDESTNESKIEINGSEVKLNSYLDKDFNGDMRVGISFHHITTEYEIKRLLVEMNSVELLELRPYHGMKTWDNPTYNNFHEVPDSLRFLSSKSNPYYAFDHVFDIDSNKDDFQLTFNILIRIGEEYIPLKKVVNIVKKTKIELNPWDAHSDITFLFIPLFGLITLILGLIKLIAVIRKK